jgi:hypothetical protein
MTAYVALRIAFYLVIVGIVCLTVNECLVSFYERRGRR